MDKQNLAVAQNIDLSITEIVASAPSVAIYGFSEQSKQWEKRNYEGALLVCSRTKDPNCCIIVLNQKSPENFVHYLDKGASLQRKSEYLLFKNPLSNDIKAIWFYKQEDCGQIFNILKDFAAHGIFPRTEKTKADARNSGMSDTGRNATTEKSGADIVKLLSNAKKNRESQGGATGGNIATSPQKPLAQLNNLFQSHGSGRDAGGIAANKQTDAGGAFQSLTHRPDGGGDFNNHGLFGQAGKAMDEFGGDGTYQNVLGKGRGRLPSSGVLPAVPPPSSMAPAVQRLLGTPGSAESKQQQQQAALSSSAFTQVGQRSRAISNDPTTIPRSMDEMISCLPHNDPNAVLSGTSPLLPRSTSSVMSQGIANIQEEWVTPADLSGHGIREQYPIPMSPLDGMDAQAGRAATGGNLMIGGSVLNREQFRQCFIYMLEHNQDFVRRLYDAFAQESTKGPQ